MKKEDSMLKEQNDSYLKNTVMDNYININLKQEGESLIESAKITLNGYINFVKSKIGRV